MSVKKNHILVPVDFSAQSQIALEQCYNLANATAASITIMYVMDNSLFKSIFESKTQKKKYEGNIQKQMDKMLALAKRMVKGPVDSIISEGKVYEEVVNTAKKLKSKFIVMGKSDDNKFIGSNTLRVVKEAPCPVITIRGSVHRPYCKNIVLPLDLTKETREKVSKAIELAKHFNSVVRVVAVLSTDDESLVHKLKLIMNQVKHHIENSGVQCTAEAIHADNNADAIINYAKKVKGDLIMMMTQQELDFTEFFIGSSAQQIINHSDIPVLSINPSGKAYGYTYSAAGLHS